MFTLIVLAASFQAQVKPVPAKPVTPPPAVVKPAEKPERKPILVRLLGEERKGLKVRLKEWRDKGCK